MEVNITIAFDKNKNLPHRYGSQSWVEEPFANWQMSSQKILLIMSTT
jgi:hypothetical protein